MINLRLVFVLSASLALNACATGSAGFGPFAFSGADTVQAPSVESGNRLVANQTAAPQSHSTPPPHHTPQSAQSSQPTSSPNTAQPDPAFRQSGGGDFLNRRRSSMSQVRDTGDGVELAFQNTPISDVVSAVIGDLLGADFVIDPQVSGTVTLRSARPVARADLPAALDRALRLSGVSLVETSDGVLLKTL